MAFIEEKDPELEWQKKITDNPLNEDSNAEDSNEEFEENEEFSSYYDPEIMKLVYYRNIGSETFLLSESDHKTINDIRSFMNSIKEDLEKEEISEEKYVTQYINARNRIYKIIIGSEKKSERTTSIDINPDESEIDLLKRYEKKEYSYDRALAKKHNIKYPEIPKGIKKEEIERYYLSTRISLEDSGKIPKADTDKIEKIQKYLVELGIAQKKIDEYKTGVVAAGPGITSISKVQFIEKEPFTPYHRFEELKKSMEQKSLLSKIDELSQKFSLKNINKLRGLSREDLLQCIGNSDVKFMSYIQKLKTNTSLTLGERVDGIKGKKSRELVWRLNDSEYTDFDEYLKAYAENLKESLSSKEDIITRYILEKNIEKIEYYLDTKKDPDFQSFESVVKKLKVTPKKEEETEKMRDNGRFKLAEIISEKYPGTENKVFNLEESIYSFPGDYNDNLRRVLFILYNFREDLDNFILGNFNSSELLIRETPKVIPENDITTNIPESIEILLDWKPTDKKEIIEWEKSLDKYKIIKITEDNEARLLRFLIKERNKLSSRREYTTATLSERSYSQEELHRIFSDECKSGKSAKEYSKLTESIIFGMSKLPEDYRYYVMTVKSTIKNLCVFLKDKNSLEEFNPEVAIPIVTEFLINNGELEKIDFVKINELISMFSGKEFIQEYFQSLREKELSAYKEGLLNKGIGLIGMKRLTRLFKNIDTREQILKEKRKEIEKSLLNDIYEPPIVLDSIPVEWVGNSPEAEQLIIEIAILKEKGESLERILQLENELSSISGAYSKKYTKVGENYIVGGFYPEFYDSMGNENYTREQLEILAGIFEIELDSDSEKLWGRIMYKINKPPEVEIKETPKYAFYKEQKLVTSKLITRYTYRPRIGVPEPGEIHEVTTKDEYNRDYAVPFKWRDNWLPIYNIKLKELADNSYINLEGPADFEESDDSTVITSKNYINVEYTESSRGAKKVFREGVAKGNVKYSTKENFDSCNRFQSEKDCNSDNSFAILDGKTRPKCKWVNRKCVSQETNPEREKFNLESIKYSDPDINKTWKIAKESSKKFIEELIITEEPSEKELDRIIWEQEDRLFQYKKELDKFKDWKESDDLKVHSTDGDGQYFKVTKGDYLSELIKDKKPIIPVNEELDDYIEINLKKQELLKRKLPKGREADIPELITVEYKALISRENYPFISNGALIYPSFYWNKETHEYIKNATDDALEIIDRKSDTMEKYIDRMILKPTGVYETKLLITKEDIINAMLIMAFSTYKNTEGSTVLERVYDFPATINAKRYTLEENKVSNLLELKTLSIGVITLKMLEDNITDVFVVVELANQRIEKELLSAIDKNDKEKIKKWLGIAKKNKYLSDTVKKAKVVKSSKTPEPEPETEPEQELEPEPETVQEKPKEYKSFYVTSTRSGPLPDF